MSVHISIRDFLAKPMAVLATDGQRLAQVLTSYAQTGQPVVLSFAGLQHVTTAFLYEALGVLLLRHPAYGPLLHAEGFASEPVRWKVDEVYRHALDAEYRQQMQAAWEETMDTWL